MGASGMLVGTVMVHAKTFYSYMFKLEFENQTWNFETRNQLFFVMRKFETFCSQTLRMSTSINIWLIDNILEDSCLS